MVGQKRPHGLGNIQWTAKIWVFFVTHLHDMCRKIEFESLMSVATAEREAVVSLSLEYISEKNNISELFLSLDI